MKRRSFIRISTIVSTTVLFPYSFMNCSDDSSLLEILATPQGLLKIMSKDAIHKIGENYKKKHPTEAKKNVLIRLLSTNKKQDTLVLEEMIAKDFTTRNIVIIDGWVLAQTEARQCALYTLTN